MTLLEVDNLTTTYPAPGGGRPGRRGTTPPRPAVDGVSFAIEAGTTVGLVGESGCGKSTLGKTLLNLLPTARVSGRVRFEGRDILGLRESEFRPVRRRIQMIFQDPFGSLNPRMTVGEIIGEPLAIHRRDLGRAGRRDRVAELLGQVGLSADRAGSFPHEFSGGQRQRIGIARALAVEPRLIVCDEPVSALDVSVQAQIVNLLQDLQEQLGLAYLFIAHDLAVVEHVSRHVLVMLGGRIVESAPADEIYRNPTHPYTRELIAAA